jgi:hypothetical protein
MLSLPPPRHISTLPRAAVVARLMGAAGLPSAPETRRAPKQLRLVPLADIWCLAKDRSDAAPPNILRCEHRPFDLQVSWSSLH